MAKLITAQETNNHLLTSNLHKSLNISELKRL